MAEVTSIRPADLRAIENNLRAIHRELVPLDVRVTTVNDNVKAVYAEIGRLAKEFDDFAKTQLQRSRKRVAHTELILVRQELEKTFGHFDMVRRVTTGILQADDLGVVRKDTISTATVETMISTPRYWIAPCLIVLLGAPLLIDAVCPIVAMLIRHHLMIRRMIK